MEVNICLPLKSCDIQRTNSDRLSSWLLIGVLSRNCRLSVCKKSIANTRWLDRGIRHFRQYWTKIQLFSGLFSYCSGMCIPDLRRCFGRIHCFKTVKAMQLAGWQCWTTEKMYEMIELWTKFCLRKATLFDGCGYTSEHSWKGNRTGSWYVRLCYLTYPHGRNGMLFTSGHMNMKKTKNGKWFFAAWRIWNFIRW